jgi:hypothetical protein
VPGAGEPAGGSIGRPREPEAGPVGWGRPPAPPPEGPGLPPPGPGVPSTGEPPYGPGLPPPGSGVPSSGEPAAPSPYGPWYPPAPGYPPYPAYPPAPNNGMAIAALVLGILGLTCMGPIAGVPAMVCGVLALRAKQSAPVAWAGVIIGALATLAGLVILGLMALPILAEGNF